MVKSYSQEAQDLKVLLHYKLKKNGYFLEIGASDGINLSNTYLLEKEYNWSGICVEPIKDDYQKLILNRSCHCSNNAVYAISGEKLEFDIYEYNLLSGINKHNTVYNGQAIKEKIIVETISLNDLLKKYNAPKFIEYLSLDTEGSEYEILSSFDFDYYKIGLIHVEHNFEESKRKLIKELLLKNDYKYIGEFKQDDFYSSLLCHNYNL
jgi:FkbM family methyltransferase